MNAIEDVPIAIPSPRETIAWEASSILCKFVATKNEKKKRGSSSKKKKKKKKEDEEENE